MILEHAPWFLFAWVFCNQAEIPVPVVHVLLGAGLAQHFREIPRDAIVELSLLPLTHSCGKESRSGIREQ